MLTKIVTLAQKFLRQELIYISNILQGFQMQSLHSKTGYVNRIHAHPHC